MAKEMGEVHAPAHASHTHRHAEDTHEPVFTGDRRKMGALVAPAWMKALAWPVAVIIAVLNVWLLVQVFLGI